MARDVRYRANNGMTDGYGGFMNSWQVLAPVMAICELIATEAAMTDGTTIAGDYGTETGPRVVVAGNPRVSGRVVNNNKKAAAYEFGTGIQNEGNSGGVERTNNPRQGGYSPARRHLGFVAAGYHDVIGDPA